MCYYLIMTRFIGVLFLIVFIWFAIPHAKNGEWFAPTALPSEHWVYEKYPEYRSELSSVDKGYGMFRFDFWNNPPTTGREITNKDLSLKKFW